MAPGVRPARFLRTTPVLARRTFHPLRNIALSHRPGSLAQSLDQIHQAKRVRRFCFRGNQECVATDRSSKRWDLYRAVRIRARRTVWRPLIQVVSRKLLSECWARCWCCTGTTSRIPSITRSTRPARSRYPPLSRGWAAPPCSNPREARASSRSPWLSAPSSENQTGTRT